MTDFNMMAGRLIAVSLFSVSSRPKGLPSSIQNIETRARLVDDIDKAMFKHFSSSAYGGQINALPQTSFDALVKDMTNVAEKHIVDIDNPNARNGVGLSVWSGCMSAAKTIALETRDGENTPETRSLVFTNIINPLCEIDELYKAGVEAAPIFKRLREDEISFDGVPPESPVRKYKDRTSTTN